MSKRIKIDIVSDIVCPWCIIGYKRLALAIKEMGIEDKVELEWQPFELNRNMPQEGQDLHEHLSEKYGSTSDQLLQSQQQLRGLGEELDFKFDFFEGMKIVNTRTAHVLLEYAKSKGLQTDLNLNLVEAYFIRHQNISDRQVQSKELQKIGIDDEEAIARTEDAEWLKLIQEKENYWQQMGISSVPTIVFNRKSALTGAQAIHIYKKVLNDILNE